jgi:AcrR family transcriptional regulator
MDKPNPILATLPGVQIRKSDLKRIEIIEAAIECMATIGIENTSFEAVGKSLKMARSHLVYYFKDKESLFRDAIQYVAAMGQQITLEHLQRAAPENQLRAYVEGTFDWIARYPQHATIMPLFFYVSATRKEYRELHAKSRNLARDRILAILAILESGKKRTPKQRTEIAERILACLTGFYLDYLATRRSGTLGEVKERALSAIFEMAR